MKRQIALTPNPFYRSLGTFIMACITIVLLTEITGKLFWGAVIGYSMALIIRLLIDITQTHKTDRSLNPHYYLWDILASLLAIIALVFLANQLK